MEGHLADPKDRFITGYVKRKGRMLEHPEAITRTSTVTSQMGVLGLFAAVPQAYTLIQVRIPGEGGKGEITSFVEWVEASDDGRHIGHAVELPPRLCDAILRGREALNAKRRSQNAKANAKRGDDFRRIVQPDDFDDDEE